MGKAHNPFASCYTDPTLGNYIFPSDMLLDDYLAVLEQNHWTATLCGPHGAGKTVLLHTLAREAELRGNAVLRLKCRAEGRLPPLQIWRLPGRDVLFLDSAECLHPLSLRLIQIVSRLLGKGLVITAYADCGVAPVMPVSAALPQFLEIVSRLTGGRVYLAAASTAFESADGNVREALFQLYDLHEEPPLDSK